MKLPPKGDPMRPLILATRSTRGVGVLCLALSTGLLAMVVWSSRRAGAPTVVAGFLVYGVIFVLPGVLYIVFSVFMQRRQLWAIIATLALVSIQAMFLLLMAAGLAMQIIMGVSLIIHDRPMLASTVVSCFLAATIVLIVQLAKSFPSLSVDRIDFDRGFVPVLPRKRKGRTTSNGPLTTNHYSSVSFRGK